MIELLGLVIVILIYILVLFCINKSRAEKLISDFMKFAQSNIIGGENKKDFVKFVSKALLEEATAKAPLSTVVNKVVEAQVDNIIEKNVDKVKEEVKQQGQRIDLGAMENASKLVDRVLVDDSKGIISLYGKAVGDTESKRIDFEVGVNAIYKL